MLSYHYYKFSRTFNDKWLFISLTRVFLRCIQLDSLLSGPVMVDCDPPRRDLKSGLVTVTGRALARDVCNLEIVHSSKLFFLI